MKICVPVRETTQKAVIKRLKEIAGQADLAEVWLDGVGDLDLEPLLAKKPLPVVCVLKRPADKGEFRGTFAALAARLTEAVQLGADYVDIPFQMPENLNKKIVQEARKAGGRVIISHHDFKATPDYPKLIKIAEEIRKRGADVVKIATFAHSLQDTVNMIAVADYLRGLKTPHIAITMGQKGILSRVLTPTLGGEMMFATLGKKGQTASGQLTVKELREAWSYITPNSQLQTPN